MYSAIKYYLVEMAIEKSELLKDLRSKVDIINEHLLKCLIIQDTTKNLDHWKKEIASFLYRVPKIKNGKKYPDEKTLRAGTLDVFSDCLLDQLDVLIKNVCTDYNIDIPKYNKNAISDAIVAYYKWLLPQLARSGIVSNIEIYNKIDELIANYNIANK